MEIDPKTQPIGDDWTSASAAPTVMQLKAGSRLGKD